jgi:hypothetical protein
VMLLSQSFARYNITTDLTELMAPGTDGNRRSHFEAS